MCFFYESNFLVGFCFKARRVCRTHIDVKKEITVTGSQEISINNSISKIKLYNKTKFLNINIGFLSSNSSNNKIAETNWSLTYYTGENFGTGTIKVEIISILDGDIINIYY